MEGVIVLLSHFLLDSILQDYAWEFLLSCDGKRDIQAWYDLYTRKEETRSTSFHIAYNALY